MTGLGRPTITDVARAAGVSKGSVSFALNGRPGVAEQTRARILEVARTMGWTPSHRARALSASRAYAVGLVIARPPELLGSDPFFARFIAGVEQCLSQHGQALLLQVVADERAEEASYRRLAADGRVDGVFLLDLRVADPRVALLDELGLPAVTLGRPELPSPFPALVADDRSGIAAAVAHLVALGHERIAHVAGPDHFLHSVARREAWAQAMAAAGLPAGRCVRSDFSASGGARATHELLDGDEVPTAIVYGNDLMAIAGLAVAAERGVEVPARLSVTGFDDTELAGYLSPALTSVRTDPLGWGRTAAGSLLHLVDGDAPGDVDLPPAQLVVRASTAPPPHPLPRAGTARRRSATPSRSERR